MTETLGSLKFQDMQDGVQYTLETARGTIGIMRPRQQPGKPPVLMVLGTSIKGGYDAGLIIKTDGLVFNTGQHLDLCWTTVSPNRARDGQLKHLTDRLQKITKPSRVSAISASNILARRYAAMDPVPAGSSTT